MSNSRLLLAIVTLCSACGGSSFEAGGSGGASAEAGATGSHGGDTSSAGASNGGSGAESSAGASGHPAGGAATAGAGGSGAGGASAGGASAGAGTGGSHAGAGGSGGASAGAGGSAGAADCTTLKAEYAAALEKARVCDVTAMNQCDKSSTLPNLGCGCPTLVNAKSEATTIAKQKYQAFQSAKCPIGPICAIACIAYTGAACTAQAMGGGFVCTGSNAGVAN
jgi:hypothetical protein